MKTYGLLLIVFVAFTKPALADHKHATVHVTGMVCDFCSTGLTKIFKAQPEVSKVNVDLSKKVVEVAFKDDAAPVSDKKIKELITDAGYNVDKIVRD